MTETQPLQQDPDAATRLGGWLFRKRTSLPIPVVLALLVIPADPNGAHRTALVLAGAALVVAGELIRMWGVHHIGAISRTRTDRLGPLIDTGPFALVRNPLYVGNLLLWVGFTVSATLLWLVPIVAVLLALEYHVIVKWEERLLESRMGQVYRDYMRRVPRWIPRFGAAGQPTAEAPPAFSWRQTLFSERGTLIAIVAGYALLWMKTRV